MSDVPSGPHDPSAPPSLDANALARVLTESTPDAIVTMDEASSILAVNPAAERMFGYAAAELVGRPLHLLMPERFRRGHDVGMGRYLATGRRHISWRGVQVAIRSKSGDEIPVEVSFGEFVADGRRLFAGFIRDVSERVARERLLAESNAQLQEQALELEAQTEELQATTEELAQRSAEATQARDAAEAERARLDRVLAQFPGAAAVYAGPRHVVRAVSAAYRAIIGGRDIVGLPLREALPELAGQGYFERLDRVYATGEPFTGTGLRAHWDADGDGVPEEHVVDLVYQPLLGVDGRSEGIVVLVQDHTERYRAEEALRESELRYRLAADVARIGTWTWDMATDAATFDARVRELFAFPDDDAQPRAGILATRVHPDDRARVTAALAAAIVPTGDGRYEAEYRIVRPDGSERTARAHGRTYFVGEGAERRPLRLVGTVVDVTTEAAARREIEQLNAELRRAVHDLEAVLDVVPIGIGIARDPACRDIRVNPAFAAQLGIASDTNASKSGHGGDALPFRVLQHGREVSPDELPMQRAAREGRTLAELEYDVVHADGRVVRLLEYAAPLRDAGGTVRGAVGVFIDITERTRLVAAERAARGEAEEARSAAERASRAKSEFLATMSHELRTPLNAIGGYADLIRMGVRGPVTEAQRTDLDRVQRSQRHLLGLINEVLNYARLESGAVTYDVRPTLVEDVVAGAVPLVEPQRAAKGLALDVRLPELEGGEACRVLADAEKLQQILLNLLSNAVKFTPAGGRVSVALDGTPDATGMVALTVRDTGVGIPADKLEAIFEPFVQVGRTLSSPGEGTGLGLAISRDLARGMGGELTVASEIGVGSTFTLMLRRA